ncbi:MAG: hypothetical protein E7495_05230 [Ruminococcus flavefaciens]|nr:hypothetical protein [Ruminococcus flavefaciens]
MKRLITFAAAIVMSLCAVSCSVPMKNDSVRRNGLSSGFTGDVSITIDKLQAEGIVQRSGEGDWNIEFSAPNTLSGVRLDFNEGNVSASYKGLTFSVPQSAVPVKSMMLNLIKAVDDNAAQAELKGEEKDDALRISGSLEGGDYTLSVDSEGNLSGFDMPNNKLVMKFSNIMVTSASAQSSETCDTTAETYVETASAAA